MPVPDKMSADDVIELLTHILTESTFTTENIDTLPETQPKLKELCLLLLNLRQATEALARGDLQYPYSGRGYAMGIVKSLASNLRTITWHLRCLAQGNVIRIDPYMGDFSKIFNELTEHITEKVQELNTLIEEYKTQSHIDVLTGLLNRRAFLETATKELLFARQSYTPLSLIMVDVDSFKRINDTYGHTAGDTVLRILAQRILGALRTGDVCCRYGGEEFLLLIRGATPPLAGDIAERLRRECHDVPFPLAEGITECITISCGVSCLFDANYCESTLNSPLSSSEKLLEESINRADTAMYAAKRQGRNKVCFASSQPEQNAS